MERTPRPHPDAPLPDAHPDPDPRALNGTPLFHPTLPRRRTPWELIAGIVVWAALMLVVVLTLWTGHPPIPLPVIPWTKLLVLRP